MASAFLSHSSADKDFVRKLAEDLKALGHTPWLDEWEIRVGECIMTRVEEGLRDCDYVIIVLTPDAVASGWVDREWKTAYWGEIDAKRVVVLPVLVKDCEIPPLIKSKRYADFRTNYAVGFAQLAQGFVPIGGPSPTTSPGSAPGAVDPGASATGTAAAPATDAGSVLKLLERAQDPTASLSKCMAEALRVAHELAASDLAGFCRNELAGWPQDHSAPGAPTDYRTAPIYQSASELNPSFVGWSGDVMKIFAYMERNPDQFVPGKLYMWEPVSDVEADARASKNDVYLHWKQESQKRRGAFIHCYARGTIHRDVLERIRTELTKRLLSLLPDSTAAG